MRTREITRVSLAEGGNVVRQGHHFTQGFTPRNAAGEPVDLTGKDINVTLYNRFGIRYETTATFDSETGIVRYQVTENIGNGDLNVEFTVTDENDPNYREKFPADVKDATLKIVQSSDDIDFVGVKSTTVAQLRNEQQTAQTEYEVLVDGKIETIQTDSAALRAEFDAAVAAVTVDSEVVLARGDSATLGGRLDGVSAQLADIAQRVQVLPILPESTANLPSDSLIAVPEKSVALSWKPADWELGSLSSSTGAPFGSSIRIRPASFLNVEAGAEYIVFVDANSLVSILEYRTDNSFISGTGWLDNETFHTLTNETVKIKVLARNIVDNYTITTEYITTAKPIMSKVY